MLTEGLEVRERFHLRGIQKSLLEIEALCVFSSIVEKKPVRMYNAEIVENAANDANTECSCSSARSGI